MSDAGALPELAWIPVSRCAVDRRYQRTLDSKAGRKLVERLAAGWRWARCGALVAMRDGGGGFVLIDGQHRAEAARRLGIAHLPALVLAECSLADQAAAFVGANRDRVSLNQQGLFHARLVAGEPEAQTVAALCRQAGIVIPRYPIPSTKLKPGETMALATFAELGRQHPAELVALAVGAVADACRGRAGQLRAVTFRAAAALLAAAPESERRRLAGRLTRALRETAPAELAVAVARRRAEQGEIEVEALRAVLAAAIAALPLPGRGAPPAAAAASPPAKAPPVPAPAATLPTPRPAAPPPAKPSPRAAEDAAIAAHLARQGAAKPAAPLDVDAVMNEVRRSGSVVVPLDARFERFRLGGARTLSRTELLARANRERRGRSLPEWAPGAVSWTRPPPPEPVTLVQRHRAAAKAARRREGRPA